ncbi:MAG: hypothetical protein NT099_09765, partial [Candidatus Saganbacteria bacterium]|nr:hypothetical protein [Candidatus Saganbacteria bacterium]
ETVYAANILADYVTEKNPYCWGLRYAKTITMATSTEIRYKDTDNKEILFWLYPVNNQIYYYIYESSPSWKPLDEYFVKKGIRVDGSVPNKIFKYIDANGNELPSPVLARNLIKQIELNWLVYSGDGNPQNGSGRVTVNTAVEINQVE